MPERPDLEYVVPILRAALLGRRITGVRVRKPVVLRATVAPEALIGAAFGAVERVGAFVCFALDGPWHLAVHPMLAGRFRVTEAAAKDPGDLALALALDERDELRYRDDVQMGKVYLHPRGGEASVPGLLPVGIDVLDPAFTVDELRRRAKGRREQVRVWLMDKAAFDGFGNAYADEVLWAAGLHPKLPVTKLDAPSFIRLHAAMVSVTRDSIDTIAARRPATDEKIRDFLAVRNRGGEPCRRCGATIRAAGVHGHDTFFCPTCQPDVAGKGFVDWRRAKG